jgi:O-antigen ligase
LTRRPGLIHVNARLYWLFGMAVLAQVAFLRLVGNLSPEEPTGIAMAAVLISPFLLPIVFLYPQAGLLCVPSLVVVPGWVMGFSLFECVLLACSFAALLRFLSSAGIPPAPSRLEWVYCLYVAWAFTTLGQAINRHEAVIGIRIIVILFVAFLAGYHVVGLRHARLLVRSLALLAVIICAQLLLLIVRSGYPLSFLLTRAGSLTDLGWGVSNYIAAVAALSTGCAVALVFHGTPREKALGLMSLGAAVFVSLATVSRGGTLAILVGLLVASLLAGKRRFFGAVGILMAIGIAYLLSPLGQASIARFVDPADLPSVAERLLFYQITIKVIQAHWLWGVGPNQIPEHSTLNIGANPHNFILKFAADLGLPGATLYLGMLAIAALAAIRLWRVSSERSIRLLALAFLLTLIIGFTNGLYEPTLEASVYGTVFWLPVGALYAASLTLGKRRR